MGPTLTQKKTATTTETATGTAKDFADTDNEIPEPISGDDVGWPDKPMTRR